MSIQLQYNAPTYPDTSLPANHSTRPRRGIADTHHAWPGPGITAAIDMKSEKHREIMVKAINEWAQNIPHRSINIVYGKEGDIRISDDEKIKGDWSAIGTEANKVPLDEPTLHLDSIDDLKEFHQTALHEFGHALGLKHEHQHPEHDINWDKKTIYDRFERPDLSRQEVYDNFFKLPTGESLLVTNYDAKSIMHYGIHPSLTKDGRGVPLNYTLSEGDKETIRKLYTPKKFQST